MCGIFSVFFKTDSIQKYDQYVQRGLDTIKHRGPDTTSGVYHNNSFLGFHRLSINDISNDGNQPFNINNTLTICNGEIYNTPELINQHNLQGVYKSKSDCEVICHMLSILDDVGEICNSLDGVFACCAIKNDGQHIAFRDPIGVRPLFFVDHQDFTAFSSEAKGLVKLLEGFVHKPEIKIFPIGHYWINGILCNYTPLFFSQRIQASRLNYANIRNSLCDAVHKRISNSDVDVGFFLSGGLDSSLVAGIASQKLGKIKTFSIGMSTDSPDILCARSVSQYINSEHHEIIYDEKEGIAALQDVIYALESYDCTTIRASIPMYILSRYIRNNTNVKVLLSGEGADELFGGYLYFKNAPSKKEFQDETLSRVHNVHMFDCLRADRCTAFWGLEVRVPFFDYNFANYIINLPAYVKQSVNNCEKYILRKAFEHMKIIPDDILYRQKNAFSDAVGYNWIDILKAHCSSMIDDVTFESEHKKFKNDTPLTKEELYYRVIFSKLFPQYQHLGNIGIWRHKWSNVIDPSATYLSFHNEQRN